MRLIPLYLGRLINQILNERHGTEIILIDINAVLTGNAQTYTCEKTSHGEFKKFTDVLSMYQYTVADSVENY